MSAEPQVLGEARRPSRPATSGRAPDLGRAGAVRSLLTEIGAGATVGLIALPFCVTSGVLAYEPLGRDFIAAGAAAGILCAVVGGITGALLRSSSFIPNIPSVPMALIQASFVSGLLTTLGGDVGAVLAIMPLSILFAGLWQVLIALTGLARAVKFTPYPVLAGFVTGLAILTFVQQAPRLFGAPSLRALLPRLPEFDLPSAAMPAFGLAVILLMRAAERFAPRLPALLVGLVLGTVLWHGLSTTWPGLPLGRTIGAVSLGQASVGVKLSPDALLYLLQDRAILQSLLLTSLTLALLGTIDYTFAFRAAQNLGDLRPAVRRDLAGQGVSNLMTSLAGGLAVTSSIAFSTTNYHSGGRTRSSTIAMAVVLLIAALLAPTLIAALPVVVLSAILVLISTRMWDRWCVVVVRDIFRAPDPDARTRARRNALIVTAVAAATVLGQPVVGALAGVVFSCLVFIVEMSRPIERRRLDCGQVFSKRIRSQADAALLRARGARTTVLQLQGVLFFGNADDLADRLRQIETEVDAIILDLSRVTDLDTSGASVLEQIARRCQRAEIQLILCGARPTYRLLVADALSRAEYGILLPDLDSALEHAEGSTLAREKAGSRWNTLRLAETDLGAGLSERELAYLAGRLQPCSYPAGTALCRAGDPADKLWLLTRGSVSVRVAGEHHQRRLAGLGPGTSVGEMGLLDRRPRSADVVADDDVEALVLSVEDFDALLRHEPHLGQSLLATIARLTAQRLRATSDELRLAEA